MNIDKLKKQFNDENSCRHFFESVIWVDGRTCPHCQCNKSYLLKGASVRCGTYECARCKRQFTVTTKTPMHQGQKVDLSWQQQSEKGSGTTREDLHQGRWQGTVEGRASRERYGPLRERRDLQGKRDDANFAPPSAFHAHDLSRPERKESRRDQLAVADQHDGRNWQLAEKPRTEQDFLGGEQVGKTRFSSSP